MASDHQTGMAIGHVHAATYALEHARQAASCATNFIERNIGMADGKAIAVPSDSIRAEAGRLRAIADRLDAALAPLSSNLQRVA